MQCCAKRLSQPFFIYSVLEKCVKKNQCPNQNFEGLQKVWRTAALDHFIISRKVWFLGNKTWRNECWLECAQCCCPSHVRCLALVPLVLNVLPHWSTVRAAWRCRDLSAAVCCSSDCRNADISLMTLCTDGRGHQSGRAFTNLCAREVWGLSGQKDDDVSCCISPTLGELLDNVWKGQTLTLNLPA